MTQRFRKSREPLPDVVRYPVGAGRLFYRAAGWVLSLAAIVGAGRTSFFDISSAEKVWDDILLVMTLSLFFGGFAALLCSFELAAGTSGVVVRKMLRRTEYSWSMVAAVDATEANVGTIYLIDGRRIRVRWEGDGPGNGTPQIFHNTRKLFDAKRVQQVSNQVNLEPAHFRTGIDWLPFQILLGTMAASAAIFCLGRLLM